MLFIHSWMICSLLLIGYFIFPVISQYEEGTNQYEEALQAGLEQITDQIESHPDVISEFQYYKLQINTNFYVEDYPISADYRLNILVDPCRYNSYNCCVNVFGTPEYPALLRPGMEAERVYQYVVLGNDSEVQKNYVYVYEEGSLVPIAAQRSPDDYKVFNESCIGVNLPTIDCAGLDYQYQRAPLRPPCMDNNYSLNSLDTCYYANGTKANFPCVQIAYFTNTIIPQCTNNDHCGTYIEMHMSHGTEYQTEDEVIGEVLLDSNFTSGYSTTVMPLTWKGNNSRVLCTYSESFLRIGSLVYIKPTAPVCCCPPPFSPDTRVGSFYCPKGATADGAFASRIKTLADTLMVDSFLLNYPFCHTDLTADHDRVMCSIYDVKDRRHFTTNCSEVTKTIAGVSRSWTSPQMEGLYDGQCPYYANCALNTMDSARCEFSDNRFTFIGRVGIVTAVDNVAAIPQVWVTFNDNRTSYQFSQEDVVLETRSKSMYEMWWVVRSPSKFTVQKKKAFNITSPPCTFDLTNNRYFPYAIINPQTGETLPNYPVNQG